MEAQNPALIEQKLNKISAYAPYVHVGGVIILLTLGHYKPSNYSVIATAFTASFLFVTFVLNKYYIYTGKALEASRTLSKEEKRRRKIEYYTRFFPPIVFWTLCTLVI